MALKRRKILKQMINLGYGTDTVPADAGGSQTGDKVGIHTFWNDAINVKAAGATGDGSADDTSAFSSVFTALSTAGGGTCLVPRGTYKTTSALSVPANVHVVGMGRGSKITKRFSGDAFTLADSAALRKLWIDGGHSQGYTGRNVVISAGNYQEIIDCRIDNSNGYCIEISGALVGSYSQIRGGLIGNRDDPYVAIKMPDDEDAAAPRHITDVDTGGAVLVDCYRANNLYITGGRNNGIVYTGNTGSGNRAGNVHISNMRMGGSSSHTIGGEQCIYSNVNFGVAVIFDTTSSSCEIGGGSLVGSWDITDNGTGNRFTIARKEYTPTWTQASGTQPALGNGTITGVYSRHQNTVTVHIKLTLGGTSTFGNNAVAYRFSVPYAALNGSMSQFGTGFVVDANSNRVESASTGPNMDIDMYACKAVIGANEAFVTLQDQSGGTVRSDSPAAYFSPTATWQSGDTIELAITYVAN